MKARKKVLLISPIDVTPPCFPSHKEYLGWRRLAEKSKEIVTICKDCTDKYKTEMAKQGKCFPRKTIW